MVFVLTFFLTSHLETLDLLSMWLMSVSTSRSTISSSRWGAVGTRTRGHAARDSSEEVFLGGLGNERLGLA
jgi:N6-adenosine-specific RNA methylase IME4